MQLLIIKNELISIVLNLLIRMDYLLQLLTHLLLFSMALQRNILDLTEDYNIQTSRLKDGIKQILQERDSNFDDNQFEKSWKHCYGDERCSIVRGRGSRLIDISKIPEHEKLVNVVHFWTREVIYHFIEFNQSV
jgi:hypothetical protein